MDLPASKSGRQVYCVDLDIVSDDLSWYGRVVADTGADITMAAFFCSLRRSMDYGIPAYGMCWAVVCDTLPTPRGLALAQKRMRMAKHQGRFVLAL